MNTGDEQDLLDLAAQAIQRAGRIALERTSHTVAFKGDRDPATNTDIEVERYLRARLDELTPDIPVLGEEEGGVSPDSGLVWVVDPIDGTVNFMHGLPIFSVSLSLLQDGLAVLAATHLPAIGTTYTSLKGFGAQADGVPMRASSTNSLREAVISIDQFTFANRDAEESNVLRLSLLQRLAPVVQRVRIHGASTVDLAWTAQGALDACIILGNHPWDTGAGALIAREAGAHVLDIEGHAHALHSRTTVAVAPGIRDELSLAILRATNP